MITLNLAYTEPVHGPNPSIRTLTQEQVWKGLELKVRRPQEFISAIDDCRVIEERDHGAYILREAHVATDLRQSPMAGQYVREECILHRPIWTHFTLPNGSEVQNIVSVGPDQSLYLTFTYKWILPDIEAGTAEAQRAEEEHFEIAKTSVQGTIKTLMAMAEKGIL
ncbi:hypothetical protein HCH54_005488 [Aspergillus fumigatus]